MVNKLTNSEIAKVFAMYWGCEYLATDGVKQNMAGYGVEFAYDNGHKLLLKPLSDITDEDAAAVFELSVSANEDNDALSSNSYTPKSSYVFQYLTSKGYAAPLYFGPDHWANGMDAIQLGIAIDEKTLNK